MTSQSIYRLHRRTDGWTEKQVKHDLRQFHSVHLEDIITERLTQLGRCQMLINIPSYVYTKWKCLCPQNSGTVFVKQLCPRKCRPTAVQCVLLLCGEEVGSGKPPEPPQNIVINILSLSPPNTPFYSRSRYQMMQSPSVGTARCTIVLEPRI